MRAIYFGCTNGLGHGFYEPGAPRISNTRYINDVLPWRRIDVIFAKVTRRNGPDPIEAQEEGQCMLHYKDGWTAIAFWDRSVNHRHGSNSVFFFDKEIETFDECLSLMHFHFPEIMERFKFFLEFRDKVLYGEDGTRIVV